MRGDLLHFSKGTPIDEKPVTIDDFEKYVKDEGAEGVYNGVEGNSPYQIRKKVHAMIAEYRKELRAIGWSETQETCMEMFVADRLIHLHTKALAPEPYFMTDREAEEKLGFVFSECE